jgi:hypothetical protein
MGEAAVIAAELDLVEQLPAANAPFLPTARRIIDEVAGRAGARRSEGPVSFNHFPMLRGPNPVCRAISPMEVPRSRRVWIWSKMACLERRCACLVRCRCFAASRRPPGPDAIVATSSSLDSGNKALPIDRSARLNWVSIVSRKFCGGWSRSALTVQTSPTARLHLHHHGGALHRELLKMTEVSAVPTRRRLAASGAEASFRPRGRDHPAIAIPLDPDNPHAHLTSPIHVPSHARALSARRPIKPNSTESEAGPHNVRIW